MVPHMLAPLCISVAWWSCTFIIRILCFNCGLVFFRTETSFSRVNFVCNKSQKYRNKHYNGDCYLFICVFSILQNVMCMFRQLCKIQCYCRNNNRKPCHHENCKVAFREGKASQKQAGICQKHVF